MEKSEKLSVFRVAPAGNYMLKVNNRNTRTRCEICSKLTIKTPEQRHCSVSIVNFEQVNAGWGSSCCSASLPSFFVTKFCPHSLNCFKSTHFPNPTNHAHSINTPWFVKFFELLGRE